MLEIEKKRQLVLGAYPSSTWKQKVKKMSEGQIVAVYIRLRNAGKIKV